MYSSWQAKTTLKNQEDTLLGATSGHAIFVSLVSVEWQNMNQSQTSACK